MNEQPAPGSAATTRPNYPPVDWHPEPFRVLVTLGESTTAGGWSSTPDRCWAPVLAALISDFQDKPVRLINSGIGANVISTRVPSYAASGKPAASERLQKHVIDHQPDLLVISYGLNDARGSTPAELFRRELIALIAAVRAGCDPLIVLLSPYFMTDFTVGAPAFGHGSHELFALFTLLTEQVARSQTASSATSITPTGTRRGWYTPMAYTPMTSVTGSLPTPSFGRWHSTAPAWRHAPSGSNAPVSVGGTSLS